MKKVVVLGAGMVGSAIARDLKKSFDVCSVDRSADALKKLTSYGITTTQADLSSKVAVRKAIAKADVVVGAVPGFMGYDVCKTVIDAGKPLVDISFFPEDAFLLNDAAKKNGVTAVVDCGVAPGMDNILLGYHYQRMQVESFTCMVGGLPVMRSLPYQYKAPFSPIDVIEEYTRPARLIENGEMVIKPALSEPQMVQFKRIGTLEAFNTDGLRTLIKTMRVKNMKELTLRYPGHRTLMEQLRDCGLFSNQPVNVNGQQIRPIDVTAAILLPAWKYEQPEPEFTVMRVVIEGRENGADVCYTYDLLDYSDEKNGISSMARTTGFTCAAAVHLVAAGLYTKKGISPPEYLGKNEKHFRYILQYLQQRNVHYHVTVE